MPSIIEVKHIGNTGNQMFQYMFAQQLRSMIFGAEVTGYDMPFWGMKSDKKLTGSYPLLVKGGHLFDIGRLAYAANAGVHDHIILKIFAQRVEYLPTPSEARKLFGDINSEFSKISDNEILINIRGAEILNSAHRDYTPLKLDFYRKIVDHSGLNPVFLGQIGTDSYSEALRSAFPRARFLTGSPQHDFATIFNSRNVCCSVSTFSWLAAWMSPHTERIHLPLAGLYNPAQRYEIDLAPTDDRRYLFYKMPVWKWECTPEQFDQLISGEAEYEPIDIDAVVELKRTHLRRWF